MVQQFTWKSSVLLLMLAISSLSAAGICQSAGAPDGSSPGASSNVSDTLKDIDRLIEQNRQLEKQNQQLIDEITTLRNALAADQSVKPTTARTDQPRQKTSTTADTEQSEEKNSAPSGSVQTPDKSAKASGATEGYSEPKMWGEWNPGRGFQVAKTERGELDLSGYMVARYLNQLPPNQTAVDHLGRPIAVQARQDFQFHRVMLFASGWFLDPKFQYGTFVWTVNDTTQVAVGGALQYNFNRHFILGMGVNPLPITRSIQGSHPYWPSYDRVMADEFFRPFFTQGLFGQGELAHRLYYKWMTGNNLSLLGVRATQLTRELNFGASLTWMPTTGEFGPRGAFGDFENHEKLATRFGAGWGFSRENRQSNENDPANNTTIRLADSLNIFDPGALANGVTVQKVTYHLLAADAGLKKRGFWIGAEGYYRLLDNFNANGPLPVSAIRDTGFYVQSTYMVVPKLVEVYAGTSYVFSNYGHPKEFVYGANWYPAKDRNYRLNLHIINVGHSPVNSTFGFYTGLLTGTIVAVGGTVLY